MTGTMWGQWGQHGVETMETTETTAIGTTWGPSGGYGDDVDNEITKNAITFKRIEIIEFRLKIWDP